MKVIEYDKTLKQMNKMKKKLKRKLRKMKKEYKNLSILFEVERDKVSELSERLIYIAGK